MSVIANDLRVGNVIRHKNAMWRVGKREHVKPGKGGAFMQLELKNILTGNKLDERLRSQEHVDILVLESIPATFLYGNDHSLEFMIKDSFEQVAVHPSLLGETLPFLQDNMDVHIERVDGSEIVGIILPVQVKLKIVDTEPCMKHQTVTASFKVAKLDNGVVIQVPQFVNVGDEVVVKIEGCSYVERAK